MIRILQVVNIMDRAGLETMLMNYYRNIDRSQIQFDFLVHRETPGAYDEEIKQLGGEIFVAPRLVPGNYRKYVKFLTKFFQTHTEYKIIHSHIDAMTAFPLYVAKKCNVPIRIAHSHTSKLDIDYKLPIKAIAKYFVPKLSNKNFACGEKAGKFLFGKKDFTIIKNAIDVNLFSFDEKLRDKKRKELGITDEIVIGHVGRYCYIKNQSFLINLLNDCRLKNCKLLLVGKGPDEEKLRKLTHKLGIENRVEFLIDRSDVRELYQVFDIFIMPSKFEGLPVVGVEAQCNGLKCVFSNKISKEVLLLPESEMLEVKKKSEDWKEKVLVLHLNRNTNSQKIIREKGYDIKIEAKKLMEKYLLFYNEVTL